MGSESYYAEVTESDAADVIGDEAEEFKRTIVVVSNNLTVGEITYTRHYKPLAMIILGASLAGYYLTILIALLILWCLHTEMLRRVCMEIHWTKYYAQERLSILSYWLSSYGYLAPWVDAPGNNDQQAEDERRTSSCSSGDDSRMDRMLLDRGSASWRAPTDRRMVSDIILLRSRTSGGGGRISKRDKKNARRPHSWRVSNGTTSLQRLLSFKRPPWDELFVRRRTSSLNKDFKTRCGKNCKLPLPGVSKTPPEEEGEGTCRPDP